jgi:hypothetical protein
MKEIAELRIPADEEFFRENALNFQRKRWNDEENLPHPPSIYRERGRFQETASL